MITVTLMDDCRRIAKLLAHQGLRVVFAESCTAGLVSASLARVPGISEHHCGAAVTYRNQTKRAWLGLSSAVLRDPGPVSRIVARQMAEGVLKRTPEADLALSVTGHLGPRAPAQMDGLVYVGLARRGRDGRLRTGSVQRHRLTKRGRASRQREAAHLVLQRLLNTLQNRN
jgi:PncC family amidohydrolase